MKYDKIDPNAPASPSFLHTDGHGPCRKGPTGWETFGLGITIRQHLAAVAMQGILSTQISSEEGGCYGADWKDSDGKILRNFADHQPPFGHPNAKLLITSDQKIAKYAVAQADALIAALNAETPEV
jgi:hypothetical protein